MQHRIECQNHSEVCDGCAAVGDVTPAVVCTEIFDEGNGWQSWHYCEDCWDALKREPVAAETGK